eukprot:m.78009 g.78009  ORF g.78009 m.78009 type:complete len:278 (-) comp12652_c0_seq1:194-1027(-)
MYTRVKLASGFPIPRFVHSVRGTQSNSDHVRTGSLAHIKALSFSGAGFLTPFHAGVIHELTEHGLHIKDNNCILYGASGGAIVAAAAKCGLDPETQIRIGMDMIKEAKETGIWGKVGGLLESKLHTFLPEDAAQLCNKAVGLAVLNVWPNPGTELVCEFKDKNDLISTIMASCYIPLFLAPPLVYRYRSTLAIDGGLGCVIPQVPGALEVHPFPIYPRLAKPKDAKMVISPSLLSSFDVSLPRLMSWAFGSLQMSDAIYLYDTGRQAAREWIKNYTS